MKKNIVCLLVFSVFFISCNSSLNSLASSLSFERDLTYAPVLDANPLKGFMSWGAPSSKNNIPISVEYLPVNWDKVMIAENYCDFSYLENALNDSQKRHHQVVLRFVIDVPQEPLHLPLYIANHAGMSFDDYVYGNKGPFKSPDYENEYFVSQLIYFIEQLGKKYDGDPRIASIQTGLLGHWGEQHLYYVRYKGSDGAEHEKIIPPDTLKKFIKVFGENFHRTKLAVRKPVDNNHKNYPNIGYYHDMLCSSDDDKYMDELFAKNYANPDSWKTSLFSGEIAPGLQKTTAQSFGSKNSYESKYFEDIQHFHVSVALFSELFETENINIEASKYAQSKMGYDLYVNHAVAEVDDTSLNCKVTIKNSGVAPFYYDWKVQLALSDGNKILKTYDTAWDISTVESENQKVFNAKINLTDEKPEGCYLLLKVVNPMESGIPFKFANSEQNSLHEGWLTLGKL